MFTSQTGHLQIMNCLSDLSTLDGLVHHLRLCEVVQDLPSRANPTQETCAIEHADYFAGPTRQHELDHTDQQCIYISAVKELLDELSNDLSQVSVFSMLSTAPPSILLPVCARKNGQF